MIYMAYDVVASISSKKEHQEHHEKWWEYMAFDY